MDNAFTSPTFYNQELIQEIRQLEDFNTLTVATGLLDSSSCDSNSSLGYGSYNSSWGTPDTSSSFSENNLTSGDAYGNYVSGYMNDYGYSHTGDYYPNVNNGYMTNTEDQYNHDMEQSHLLEPNCDITKQDMFSVYTPNTENYTNHFTYDHPSHFSTCENDKTWAIEDNISVDNVNVDYFKPEQDFGNLMSGLGEMQLHSILPSNTKHQARGKPRKKKQSKDVNVSQDAMHVICKMIPGSGNRARCPKNWEFLMRLLANPETNPSVICWEDRENYIFRLVEPEKIVQLWNAKAYKCSQNYDNFARGLRYHYQRGVLQPVPEKQLVYRCGPVAIQYFNNIGPS